MATATAGITMCPWMLKFKESNYQSVQKRSQNIAQNLPQKSAYILAYIFLKGVLKIMATATAGITMCPWILKFKESNYKSVQNIVQNIAQSLA